MNHVLKLELERVDGALLRVIGMTERRGWSTSSLITKTCDGNETLDLAMGVIGDRSVDLLVRQLARLQNVRTVGVAS